ncbi:MAG: hypothetical protein R3F65_30485 [bacterium]
MSDGPFTPRCSDAEAEARVTQVIRWISEGQGRREVLQSGAEAWGLATRQMDAYLGRAYAAMRADTHREREELIAEHVIRREALFRLCLAEAARQSDIEGAAAPALSAGRAVLTDLARLQALYATDRASLARAGLDDTLAKIGLGVSAEELRDTLEAVRRSRADRGLSDDTRAEAAEYVSLPGDDSDGTADEG